MLTLIEHENSMAVERCKIFSEFTFPIISWSTHCNGSTAHKPYLYPYHDKGKKDFNILNNYK